MSWLRRGGRASAGEGDERAAPGDLAFEYLPLPPTALLRVSARWPDAERSAPDVLLIVDVGIERMELEPLPDPAAAERSGWRAAFAAPYSVVEASDVAYALRIGGEDLRLGAPGRREIEEETGVGGGEAELAEIAAALARRDDLEERLEQLSAGGGKARKAAREAEARGEAAETARAEDLERLGAAEAARGAAEERTAELEKAAWDAAEERRAGLEAVRTTASELEAARAELAETARQL